MKNAQVRQLADYAVSSLKALLPTADITSMDYITNFGHSHYINVSCMHNGHFAGSKLRISDHSVGCFRYGTDVCYYASNKDHVDAFIKSAHAHITSLLNSKFEIIWRSYNKNYEIDINDYCGITKASGCRDNLYYATRKADGALIKIYSKLSRVAE